jgi:hypothetical protein
MDISQATAVLLRRRRKTLIERMVRIDPAVIRGSLVERYKRCGKPGCKCMAGKGHGPKYYLTLCLGKGKLDAIYVPQQDVNKVRGCVGTYHRVQEAFKELCDINRELLRRREPF